MNAQFMLYDEIFFIWRMNVWQFYDKIFVELFFDLFLEKKNENDFTETITDRTIDTLN